jgi:hypothetical protein
MAIDTTRTPMAVRFQKKSCITADDDPIRCKIYFSDVSCRYPSMVNQTSQQMQTKPQHSPWLKSEYHGDRYNENINGVPVGEEKLHHSR